MQLHRDRGSGRWEVRLALLLAAMGCGRIGFDEPAGRPCAVPVGHDEDHDGVDDACDGCPHLPDPEQLDSDGDGVDDICDPNPMSPRETIAFFDPFVTMRPEWSFTTGQPTYDGDSISVDTRTGLLTVQKPESPVTDVYVLGGFIGAGDVQRRQVTLGLGAVGAANYYCELEQGSPAAAAKLGLTHTFDAMTYAGDASAPIQAPIEDAGFALAIYNAPPTAACTTTYPGDAQRIEAAIPVGISPVRVTWSVKGLVARFDYFLHIHTE